MNSSNFIKAGILILGCLFVLPVQAETLLERGTYLMKSIVACGNCHTPKGPNGEIAEIELAGGFKIEEKPFTAIASNITRDKETGIGNWTDKQLIKSIREGIRPGGSLIGPPMPYEFYRELSDRDVKAIVAYLRNVKPVKNKVVKSVYRIPLPKSYGPPVGNVADIDSGDKVKYGRYLTGPAGHCLSCHTPMIKGQFDFENQLGRGGQPFEGPWGISIARNITSHKSDGLGSWTDAEIKKAITQGIRRDGTKLFPPMGYHYYKNIRDDDLSAIIAYLRTIKPLPALK